jgi:hypothetical protein
MLNGENKVAGRTVGVQMPSRRGAETGRAKTVVDIAEAHTYLVKWTDDNGTVHQELMHRINGLWSRAPNGESYVASLKIMKPDVWLAKQLEEMHLSRATPVKSEDTVDVADGG